MDRNRYLRIVVPGAVGVVPFLPTDLSDLAVWLRGDKGITTQGGAMDKWLFENGTFRGVDRVSQGTGSAQPTHIVSDANYNGHSVISYDGGDFLDSLAFSSQISQPNTIFIVGNYALTDTREYMFDMVNLDSSGDRNQITKSNINEYRNYAGVVLTSVSSDNNVNVFEHIFNGASSKIIVNGVVVASGDVGAMPIKDITIGGGAWKLNGKVGEVIVYNRLLTADESLQVREYLQSRYQTPALP